MPLVSLIIGLLLLLVARPLEAAWAIGNTAACGGNTCSTSATDMTQAGGVSTDLIVCAEGSANGNGGITSSPSNTWHSTTQSNGTSGTSTTLFYAATGATGGLTTSSTMTFTLTNAGNVPGLVCAAISGSLTSADPNDTSSPSHNAITTAGTSMQPGSLTPSGTDLFVYSFANACGGGETGLTSSTTLLAQQAFTGGINCMSRMDYQTSGSATNPTWTWTSNDTAQTVMYAFKSAGGGATAKCTLNLLGVGPCDE